MNQQHRFETPARMSKNDHAIEQRDQSQRTEGAGKQFAIPETEKPERQYPRDDIPNSFDSKQFGIVGIVQRHTESKRTDSRIQKFTDTNNNDAERYDYDKYTQKQYRPLWTDQFQREHPNPSGNFDVRLRHETHGSR
jgi:hypothetical protein